MLSCRTIQQKPLVGPHNIQHISNGHIYEHGICLLPYLWILVRHNETLHINLNQETMKDDSSKFRTYLYCIYIRYDTCRTLIF